jgi:hypothetical protein
VRAEDAADPNRLVTDPENLSDPHRYRFPNWKAQAPLTCDPAVDAYFEELSSLDGSKEEMVG